MTPTAPGSVLIIGGGIAGLAAAEELRRRLPEARITVLEGTDRVGGKLRGEDVAGRRVDVGAEAYLHRRPEVTALVERLGLSGEVTHPTGAGAQIWSRGRIHPMPRRTFMGVPADASSLRGLLTEEEVARAEQETTPERAAGPAAGETSQEQPADLSVAELVSDRLGPAVTERLVEPLLGGVHAGRPDLLSARATLAPLFAAVGRGESLTGAVAAMMPAPADGTQAHARPDDGRQPARPAVFGSLRGGMHRLPAALAEHLTAAGVEILTDVRAREIHGPDPDARVNADEDKAPGGYTVVTGPVPDPTTFHADAVVVATPPAPASRLLSEVAPAAAAELAEVETASMAVLTFAFRTAELGEISGSGILVPAVDGRTIKAATFSATKWDHVRETGRGAGPAGEDLTFLRCSVGRHREEPSLQRSDADLIAAALADLGEALGRDLPEPVDAHVQRWGGGLPQHTVGHVDRVARIRADLAARPGLTVAGATYDGVGIPATLASAHRAVEDLLGAPGHPNPTHPSTTGEDHR